MIYIKTFARRVQCLLAIVVALGGSTSAFALAEGQPQNLPTVNLGAGMYNINAMVASTPDQRQIGLMYRRNMAAHEGMLFVFEERSPQCFWMRNTPLPLAIAFVRDDGTIVNTDEMKPMNDNSHCSAEPVRYVLEMNTGWFSKRGMKAGSRLTGAPFAPAAK